MQGTIEELKLLDVLDPDEEEENVEVIQPSSEGLSRRKARELLIEEMNKIKQTKNVVSLTRFNKALNDYWEARSEAIRAKDYKRKLPPFPTEPIYTPVFSERGINEAVHMARHRGGYEELLRNCGFHN